MAVTYEIANGGSCVLAHVYKNVGLYAHLVLWLCESYLKSGSHSC